MKFTIAQMLRLVAYAAVATALTAAYVRDPEAARLWPFAVSVFLISLGLAWALLSLLILILTDHGRTSWFSLWGMVAGLTASWSFSFSMSPRWSFSLRNACLRNGPRSSLLWYRPPSSAV